MQAYSSKEAKYKVGQIAQWFVNRAILKPIRLTES
jgi:hypothetical protein